MRTEIFFLILNEETFKELPEKLSNSKLVKFEISENVPENEIIVTSSSGQDDRKTINTFLHSTNVILTTPNRAGDPFSFYIHKRVSTEIFSPRSIALITLK